MSFSTRPVDRDKAETELLLHIKKATSPEETAPKQKHVRACIVYTWDYRSSASVWHGFRTQPMLGDEVQTFKALISVHKIIRDGHPTALKDAQKETDWLDQCARSTSQYDGRGYSTLIRNYVDFLHSKLRYHNNHPEFNGTFDYKEYISLKGIDDPNEGYETITDLMNLQDQIDQFQKLVFANFRPSSNNECRIAALVPLVEESYAIYKFATSMLRAMHKRTNDPEGLILLRQRYNAQHYALIKFYYECSNLKYLTSLISVPKLPQDPPNLLGSDSPPLTPQRKIVKDTPPQTPEPDWAAQQREIAKKQREYELEQNRLQQQREMEQQQQQMEALRLQQNFEEQQHLQMERERQQREQLAREQMQRQAEGRLAELERDVLALRGQYERDQMLIDQYDRRVKGLEQENQLINMNAQQQLASKDAMIQSIQEQINIWKSKYEALAKLYSHLRQEHLDLLTKFKTVQLKANSAQEAVDKMEKMQKEIKDKNLQMADMVRERDRAKNELLRWQNTQNDEIARLKRDLEMANGRVEDLGRSKSSEVGAMVAKFNREKQDLEDLANRRQREIDSLIRQVEDQKAEIERMQIENEEEKAVLESGLDETLLELATLRDGQNEQSSVLQGRLDTMINAHKRKLQEILDSILETCYNKVEESIYNLETPTQPGNQHATPEFTLSIIEKAQTASTEFELTLMQYLRTSSSNDVNQIEAIRSALHLSQALGDVTDNAKGITRLAKKDEDAEDIVKQAKEAAQATQQFFKNVMSSHLGGLSPEGSIRTITRSNEDVQSILERLAKAAENLIPKNNQLGPSKLDLGDMVEVEMGNAARTIEEATARLQALIAKPKNDGLSAVELQVNASILESAMAMMRAIGHLIKCATISQQEVVAQGRGTSTNAAFYKKNNRWTEGLISAAKAVAMATTLLVETADGVISKTHSMEQLLVASNEVAAATAQLVAASRVKANFMSKAQDNLERASRDVTEASRALVRAVKAIMEREMKQREAEVDYQNMNAHEFKIKEMSQQVEILKLEKELTLARRVLGEMRKVSYHQSDD
ncbi:ANTH-domain-containing protein [Gamsiella multidivaricata]|uniref:ANTH-domain-containing protein n=1 Tax=Gamsiella multidivaricata TaxID=101098 RepID=UPI00221FD87F|nr:ANTH-domain-containing protein [Gamsiella multidivaricata]KAG0371041.1 sla2 Src-like adaptor 2 [Gamsiella multidivaricata]KAI7828212.1 ANTH-domain-containing protein [Gamsiella multidivaricata]